MQLFQLWQDSLKIFIPRNFKLFGLVSLNATIQTYKIWLGRFWPLFVVSLLVDLFFVQIKSLASSARFALYSSF